MSYTEPTEEVTETTQTGFLDRLGNSFSGIGMGLLLFVAGTGLLWWNEGDFVATRDALNETQSITQKMTDITKVDPAMNGKVVHASGRADTKDVLKDGFFDVGDTAIALKREVEYYQWLEHSSQEKREKIGGGVETVTKYSYSKGWSDKPINSSTFKSSEARRSRANFVLVDIKNQTMYAADVTFGGYKLPDTFVRRISGDVPLQVVLSDEKKKEFSEDLYRTYPKLKTRGTTQSPKSGTTTSSDLAAAVADYARSNISDALLGERYNYVHAQADTVYIGANPSSPAIGDVRVKYTVVRPADISLIARVNGSTFEAYHASNGKDISRLVMGIQSMESMYGDAHSSNETMTWVFRVLGALLIIGGLKAIVAPLAVVASVIPLFGTIVGAGTGLVCTLLGGAWSLIVIATAWLRFRPLIGGGMIAVAVLLVAVLYMKGRGKKLATMQPKPTPLGPTA